MLNRLRSMWTIPDLRNKILFTIAMLLVFRIMAYVPVPGINPKDLNTFLNKNNSGLNQIFGLLDIFSGGSLQNFGVVAMGLYPYITATIVIQLLQPIIPKLDAMAREGEAGRNRIAQISRYITVPLALLQAFGQMALLVNLGAIPRDQFNLFNGPSFLPTLSTIITLTAGTMFLVWLGELITENGIGNGVSLIIFANILVKIPQTVGSALVSSSGSSGGVDTGSLLFVLAIIALVLAMTFSMVYIYLSQRRVPVQYPTKRRFLSGQRAGQTTTYIPLQVNSAGMIPIIFAQSVLLLPTVLASYLAYSTNKGLADAVSGLRLFLDPSTTQYWVLFGLGVALFTFFYATVIWQQQNMAENLQKQGAYIPGIRPGPPTEQYLYKILKRVTLGGALFLGIVSVAPVLFGTGSVNRIPTAASLLIVVGVVLDTMKQLEAQMVMRNYSGFLS
ncbi:MAG TPA: preprotein translocase subunit SecY [Ktedonobacterales bacterium]|jgi:preprotein translocase subunit SecY|nr:preprotein translocase subunit SecY [Ktedonobacterales bacterium]